MLKAKIKTNTSLGKKAALEEILKEEEIKRLNVNIPKKTYKILQEKLLQKDITISEWIRIAIDNYLSIDQWVITQLLILFFMPIIEKNAVA